MRMPYTQVLLEATPHLEGEAHSVLPASAAGSPPDLRSAMPGCSFAPRCPQAEDKCHVLTPPLEGDGSGHEYACWFPLSLEEVAHR
jgi:oligopeptide/dipeptide ABC transporter ATP-binding protein